jgi:hypothetical protein
MTDFNVRDINLGRSIGKFITNNLKFWSPSDNDTTWGYIVYRTIFTPNSDDQWQGALEKIREYIEFAIMRETQFPVKSDDDRPNKEVIRRLKIIPVSDNKFNNASLNEIRKDFTKNYMNPLDLVDHLVINPPRDQLKLGLNALVIDNSALDSISTAPSPEAFQELNHGQREAYHVKVVDGKWKGHRPLKTGYRGWARSQLDVLWDLWDDELRESAPQCEPDTGDFLYGGTSNNDIFGQRSFNPEDPNFDPQLIGKFVEMKEDGSSIYRKPDGGNFVVAAPPYTPRTEPLFPVIALPSEEQIAARNKAASEQLAPILKLFVENKVQMNKADLDAYETWCGNEEALAELRKYQLP